MSVGLVYDFNQIRPFLFISTNNVQRPVRTAVIHHYDFKPIADKLIGHRIQTDRQIFFHIIGWYYYGKYFPAPSLLNHLIIHHLFHNKLKYNLFLSRPPPLSRVGPDVSETLHIV